MSSTTFIVLVVSHHCIIITTDASGSEQMHKRAESASSSLSYWPALTYNLNTITDQLLGHVQDWRLLCICLIHTRLKLRHNKKCSQDIRVKVTGTILIHDPTPSINNLIHVIISLSRRGHTHTILQTEFLPTEYDAALCFNFIVAEEVTPR